MTDGQADQREGVAAADRRAANGRKRRALIQEDYEAFAYGAIEDLRRAMEGRSLATEKAMPLLLLWSAVARNCARSFETLMQEFCASWCKDPAGLWAAFDTPTGVGYVRSTPMFPGRQRLRAAFGLDALDGPWVALVTRREWETNRKAEQRARARAGRADGIPIGHGAYAAREAARRALRRPRSEPAQCIDGRPRGATPWVDVGVSRTRWYGWTQIERIEAAEKAGVHMPWLYERRFLIEKRPLGKPMHGRAFFS